MCELQVLDWYFCEQPSLLIGSFTGATALDFIPTRGLISLQIQCFLFESCNKLLGCTLDIPFLWLADTHTFSISLAASLDGCTVPHPVPHPMPQPVAVCTGASRPHSTALVEWASCRSTLRAFWFFLYILIVMWHHTDVCNMADDHCHKVVCHIWAL